ncbi:unnamed protein product [Polarella glacialis]|uniref:Uncharacterized protein n=1 Tax=Polarella glacialis TaxID=89957 RepID=A0A813HXD2_POLGL|nr:unnamed protein product [Polarella glacialis]
MILKSQLFIVAAVHSTVSDFQDYHTCFVSAGQQATPATTTTTTTTAAATKTTTTTTTAITTATTTTRFAKYGAEPGNFGTGYLGRKIKDPAERRLKLTTELNNGRLAMIATTAMLVQNGLTGQSPIDQLTSGHISPFNDGQGYFAQFDPSKELGACPPLGYWDPFGMMAFQDEVTFRKNREAELKHGRVCMAATIGVFVPDIFGKFPGYLSPSMNLKFSDIPSTIDALYKVPALGWLQIFALAGALEAKNEAFPTDYGYPAFAGNVGKLKEPERSKKLLAEINNGRLVAVCVIFSLFVACFAVIFVVVLLVLWWWLLLLLLLLFC